MSRKDLPTHNCVQEVVSAVATATEEQGKKMDFMSGSVSMMQQQLCEVRTSFATLQEQTGSSLAKKTRQIEEISRDIQALKRVSKTTLLLIQLLTLPSVLHRTQSVLSLKS
jgi:predicted  nucleic acid-binding Zn-ribbon protein